MHLWGEQGDAWRAGDGGRAIKAQESFSNESLLHDGMIHLLV